MKYRICLIDCQAVFLYNYIETAGMGKPQEAAQPPAEALPQVLLLCPLLFAPSKAMCPPWEASFIVLSGLQGHYSPL